MGMHAKNKSLTGGVSHGMGNDVFRYCHWALGSI
jgi:hypothetical protein